MAIRKCDETEGKRSEKDSKMFTTEHRVEKMYNFTLDETIRI